MLESALALMAVTVLEELQRRHAERFDAAVLRTLQRRVRQWRTQHGGEREIFFAQAHPPGRLGLSDFAVTDELGVSIAGLVLPHRLYQFAFAHSGWLHACIVLGERLRGSVQIRHPKRIDWRHMLPSDHARPHRSS